MDWVVIQGVPPYDGRWPFDLERQELTTREWGWIKRFTGYLPIDLTDQTRFGDPELITVFAAIALRRAGKADTQEVPRLFDRLADAPFGGAITLNTDTPEEADAGPPPPRSNGSTAASGTSSATSSETSPPPPSSSGTPASDSSASGPPTLVT